MYQPLSTEPLNSSSNRYFLKPAIKSTKNLKTFYSLPLTLICYYQLFSSIIWSSNILFQSSYLSKKNFFDNPFLSHKYFVIKTDGFLSPYYLSQGWPWMTHNCKRLHPNTHICSWVCHDCKHEFYLLKNPQGMRWSQVLHQDFVQLYCSISSGDLVK